MRGLGLRSAGEPAGLEAMALLLAMHLLCMANEPGTYDAQTGLGEMQAIFGMEALGASLDCNFSAAGLNPPIGYPGRR